MKNIFFLFLVGSFLSLQAVADQKATLTCTGSDIVLKSVTPYLGEESEYSQTLFVLQQLNGTKLEDVAYFLNVDTEGAAGRSIYTGHNEVGGYFQLDISRPVEIGDGTIIQAIANGTLTYRHGYIQGTDEKVNCTLE